MGYVLNRKNSFDRKKKFNLIDEIKFNLKFNFENEMLGVRLCCRGHLKFPGMSLVI